jgi:hypothetical protein
MGRINFAIDPPHPLDPSSISTSASMAFNFIVEN